MLATAERAQEIEERWFTNFESYANDLLKIQTEEMSLIPFRMNEVQKLLHKIISDIRKANMPLRLCILKARREGISTYTTGRNYWKTATGKNRYAMLITHEPDATDFLFSMAKRYHTHNEWKPETRYSNKKILEFNTKDGMGLDSAIRVATAGKEDVGSGQLIHYLHCSELAKWDKNKAKAILTSVLQCVPNDIDSEVIFESTAKGIGGEFHSRYKACRYVYEIILKDGKPGYKMTINESADKDNIYAAVFFPWYVFKKYQMEVPKNFKLTDEEVEMKNMYGLEDTHIQWRRWAIPNLCGGDPLVFMQEYPSNPKEAFITSGDNVFDVIKCLDYKKHAPEPIIRYDVRDSGDFIADNNGRLRVWKEPQGNRTYAMAIDVAEGIKTGDFSCIDVVDRLTGEHMAQWHGKIAPLRLAALTAFIGRRYNDAWAIPERNMHVSVVERLFELKYPRIWVEKKPEPPHGIRKVYGWTTSRTTKPMIIDNMINMIEEGLGEQIKCADTFDEMATYKEEDGKMEASKDCFDDRVMTICIAQYCRHKLPMPSNEKSVNANKFDRDYTEQKSNPDPSPLGW